MAVQIGKPRGDTTYHNTITPKSVKDLVSPSQTAMVYGFQHCKYTQVDEALSHRIDRVYDCSLGNDVDPIPNAQSHKHRRLGDQSMIHKIDSGITELRSHGGGHATQECNRKCKAGLVNQVIENYEKQKLGINITPIIFCIDLATSTVDPDGNPYPLTSENLLSKTKVVQPGNVVMNRVVTHSELRRAYKLCEDPKVDSRIRDVAKKTFKFARVSRTRTEKDIEKHDKIDHEIHDEYSLKQISAPWEAHDFASELAKRKAHQSVSNPDKTYDWRAHVNAVCAKDAKRSSKCSIVTKVAAYGLPILAAAGLLALRYFNPEALGL